MKRKFMEDNISLSGRFTWAEIDLDVIADNVREFKKAIGPGVDIIIAAKGNGYGHGLTPIVKTLDQLDIYGFATGNIHEAILMRKNGITKPIQLFAHVFPESAQLLLQYDLMPSIVQQGEAKAFSEKLGRNVPLKVWIKCDTGLGRLGLRPEDVMAELEYIRNNTSLIIEGFYSHIGPTDEDYSHIGHTDAGNFLKKSEYNLLQIERFGSLKEQIEGAGFQIPHYQLASTFAVQAYPEAWFNSVCVGTGLFFSANPEHPKVKLPLRNALIGVYSRLITVKHLKAGDRCLNIPIERDTLIGVIPYGVCDGFSVRNQGGDVLVGGRRCRIMAVCLEHTVIDLSNAQNAYYGDMVVILGEYSNERISIEECAERSGISLLNYTCAMSFHSFPHLYIKGGEVVDTVILS